MEIFIYLKIVINKIIYSFMLTLLCAKRRLHARIGRYGCKIEFIFQICNLLKINKKKIWFLKINVILQWNTLKSICHYHKTKTKFNISEHLILFITINALFFYIERYTTETACFKVLTFFPNLLYYWWDHIAVIPPPPRRYLFLAEKWHRCGQTFRVLISIWSRSLWICNKYYWSSYQYYCLFCFLFLECLWTNN